MTAYAVSFVHSVAGPVGVETVEADNPVAALEKACGSMFRGLDRHEHRNEGGALVVILCEWRDKLGRRYRNPPMHSASVRLA